MSKEFELQTHESFIKRNLEVNAIDAVFEIIWNSCDADATNIEVDFYKNEMDNVDSCVVEDNGEGIDFDKIQDKFKFLGFSEKSMKEKTAKGRYLHGRLGQGRYLALSVATQIVWETTYKKEDNYCSYTITIRDNKKIILSDVKKSKNGQIGTKCTIDFNGKKGVILNDYNKFKEKFICNFAPYLKSYNDIEISIDRQKVTIDEYINYISNDSFDFIDNEGVFHKIILTFIQWKKCNATKMLYFCNQKGSVLERALSIKKMKDCDAYLCSDYFTKDEKLSILKSYAMDNELTKIVDDAIECIEKILFDLYDEEIIREINKLKEDNIYPYSSLPKNQTEKAEQKQFAVLAVEINKIIPQLKNATKTVKRVTYSLLKEAVKTAPDSFTEIINNVIKLTNEQKDDLARLLKTTSLPAIIKTSKLVVDRLNFLDALNLMVYDDNVEKGIKERTQFQKILLDNLWLFGEDYTYGVDDVSVKNLLKKYVAKLGRKELCPQIEAEAATDLNKIPDICLFNKYPLGENRFKNLVVEIKKPKKTLGKKEYDQIIAYHDIITKNAAFPGVTTKWHFILIGKDFDEYVATRIKENEVRLGNNNIILTDNSKVTILSWGEIINNNKAKLDYLRQTLEYQVKDESDVIGYLHENYGKYLTD